MKWKIGAIDEKGQYVVTDENGIEICTCHDLAGADFPMMLANASLIAKAPELMALCQELLNCVYASELHRIESRMRELIKREVEI